MTRRIKEHKSGSAFWFWCTRFVFAALASFALLFLLAAPEMTHAQVVQVTGGSSSLYDANGASLEIRGDGYTNRFDFGYTDKFQTGFSVARNFAGGVLDGGDQTILFTLPTDTFDQSHYFLARGAGYTRGNQDTQLLVFGGMTAEGFYSPFLNLASVDTPTVALFYERKFKPHWKLYSRNTFSHHQTSIQSLEWRPQEQTRFAASGGIGNNQGYGAFSLTHTGIKLIADVSYSVVGDRFLRVLASTPQVSEADRENARIEYRPTSNLHLIVSRNNYATLGPDNSTEHAAVNGVGAWGNIDGLQMYGSTNQSTSSFGDSTAFMFGSRKDLTSRIGVGFDYLSSRFEKTPATSSVVGTIREVISSRLSLTELITHSGGQTNVSFGGTFVSNWVSVSAEYQTLYFPFSVPGTPQFRQVMQVGLHFQLPHGVQLDYATQVSATGQIRYSGYGTSIFYRTPGGISGGPGVSGKFYSNVARGRVVDPAGNPVEGAAIRIGKDLVYSDSKGIFLLRVKSAGELPLTVALDEFTTPGSYAVISAPAKIRTAGEDSAQEYKVIVKRVPALSTGKEKDDSF